MIPAGGDQAFDEQFQRWMTGTESERDDEACLRLLFRCPRCGTTLHLIELDHWHRGQELVAACLPCNIIETRSEWMERSRPG